jgi:hypothetical protein
MVVEIEGDIKRQSWIGKPAEHPLRFPQEACVVRAIHIQMTDLEHIPEGGLFWKNWRADWECKLLMRGALRPLHKFDATLEAVFLNRAAQTTPATGEQGETTSSAAAATTRPATGIFGPSVRIRARIRTKQVRKQDVEAIVRQGAEVRRLSLNVLAQQGEKEWLGMRHEPLEWVQLFYGDVLLGRELEDNRDAIEIRLLTLIHMQTQWCSTKILG